MNHSIRKITGSVLAVSAAVGGADAATAQQTPRPNILLIMADDLGWGDLRCYGSADMRTPNIDRLAAEGMQAMNFHANSNVSSPSRAALMTGCFPDLVGVPGVIRDGTYWNFGYLDPKAVTLPQRLREAGYRTSLIGKWHLGEQSPNLPNERGFDYFKGWLEGMIDSYTVHTRSGRNYMRENQREIQTQGHATDLFTRWAVEYIDRYGDSPDPFFMFLSYTAPHDPIEPTEHSLNRVLSREEGIDPERVKLVALIEHMDEGVGEVLGALERSGKLDNTLVVFVSDNGGVRAYHANNGPFRGGKGDMWEGGLRVPMIAWQRGVIPAARNENLILMMDLFPTLLSIAGAGRSIPSHIDGVDYAATLRGAATTEKDRVLVFVRREGGNAMGRPYYSIRFGDYKMLQTSPEDWMVFVRIADDPTEKNVINEQKIPQKLRWEYYSALQRHIMNAGRVAWQKPEEK